MEELELEPMEDLELPLEETEARSDADDGGGDAAAGTPEETNAEPEEADVMDVINDSLEGLLSKAQQEIDATTEAVAKKREEFEAAEAEAEAAAENMEELREKAQALAEDEPWLTMYQRLVVWSKEQGHCNPRRNWKSKIDAEEKALGNWSGKQRRNERMDKLCPCKKAALEHIGFTFDPKAQKWEVFHEKLKSYLAKHGKLPENMDGNIVFKEEVGVEFHRKLKRLQKYPRMILGEYKDSRHKDEKGESIRKEINNFVFTQDRIDVLTEAGLEWNLDADQIKALKEKGLNFPLPINNGPRPADGDMVALEKHSWLTMFEALVEFKRQNGHTFVTPSNSSEELYHWVCNQRKKLNKNLKKPGLFVKENTEYQVEMLSGIGFSYSKADVSWMENYDRLSAYKRLFGTVAVTDKFCSFEVLQQWVDDNKLEHLNLPQLGDGASFGWARQSGKVTIPLEERKRKLEELMVFDVPIGEEEIHIRKSNYFFRNAEQVESYDTRVLKSRREKRKRALSMMKNGTPQQQGNVHSKSATVDKTSVTPVLHERCRQVALAETSNDGWYFDAKQEREFFRRRGAIVSASIYERDEIIAGYHKFFSDGRPTALCRISGCFSPQGGRKTQYLCTRHHHMIEDAAKCEPITAPEVAEPSKETESEDATNEEGKANNSTEQEAVYSCPYCEENNFDSYEKLVHHEKDCGTVEEATKITAPANPLPKPSWTKVQIPQQLRGEAKILAEHYRHMVWKVTVEYRNKISRGQIMTKTDNELVNAALGEKQPLKPDEETFRLPTVKFPSKYDEAESIKLFRRCGGPLAATFSGRERLVKNDKTFYDDGRPLRFCRVAGCQMVHADSDSRRHLCNWHHVMIEKGGKTTRDDVKMAEVQAYNRAKEATRQADKAAKATAPAKAAASAKAVPLQKTTAAKKPRQTFSPPRHSSAQKPRAATWQSARGRRNPIALGANYAPFLPSPYGWAPPPPPNSMLPSAYAAFSSAMKPAAAPTMMHRVPAMNANLPPGVPPKKFVAVSTAVGVSAPAQSISLPKENGSPKPIPKTSSAATASETITAVATGAETKAKTPNTTPDVQEKTSAIQKDSAKLAAAVVEAPLEPADADMSQFIEC